MRENNLYTIYQGFINMAKNTIIDGIAASEHLDSSGESLSIQGMDISSLGGPDSILNWEHGSKDRPSQVVGKVTFAKKIMKESDAKTKREKYFWNKTKKPMVYIKAELFDGVGHSGAQDVAAMLKYKNKDKGEDSRLVVGFSIEGGKMEKKGMIVTKSIARDVAITVKPCNKVCDAELIEDDVDEDFLYKNQEFDCEIMAKGEYLEKSRTYRSMILQDLKKTLPSENNFQGLAEKMKNTNSFKQKGAVAEKIGNAANKDISLQEGAKPKRSKFEEKKPKLPKSPSLGDDKLKTGTKIKYNRNDPSKKSGVPDWNSMYNSEKNNMRKALMAGMMGGTPDSKTGGAALAQEDLDSTLQKPFHSKPEKKLKKKAKVKKSENLEKMSQPTMGFPGLGIENKPEMQVKRLDPETMREKRYKTKSGKEYSQADIEGKKVANKVFPNKEVSDEKLANQNVKQQNLRQKGSKIISEALNPKKKAGTTASGVPYDYSRGQSREKIEQTKGKGNFPSTSRHEGFHAALDTLGKKFSDNHRTNLISHIVDNYFDPKDVDVIDKFVQGRGYKKDNKRLKEEYLTHMMDLLTNPKKRDQFHNEFSHALSGDLKPGQAQQKDWDRMNRIKSGYLNAVNAMKKLTPKDLELINRKYSQPKQKEKKEVKVQRVAPGVSGLKG
jgi:hypothetical protein